MNGLLFSLLGLVGLLIIWLLWRGRKFHRVMNLSRLKESFTLQAHHIQQEFLERVRGLGKPRGLYWKKIEFANHPVFIQDQQSKQYLALLSCIVEFEALSGGDMEENPNVNLPREGTAVFEFHRGTWATQGRVLFNMNPQESLALLGSKYHVVLS